MTYMGRGIFKGRRARGFHACREVRAANPKGGFWLLLVLLSALPGGFLRGASDNQRSAAYAKLPNVGNLPTLTHIEQIRGLTLEEAQRGYPVRTPRGGDLLPRCRWRSVHPGLDRRHLG